MAVASRSSGLVDGAALIFGSVVNGLAAYAYIALGTRSFGAEDFAPVSILWTIWALTVAVVTFPLQHWVIRTVVQRGEPTLRGTLARVGVFVVAFAIVVCAASLAFESTLFVDEGGLFPWLAGLIVLQAAVLGFARGVLSARGRFRRVGLVIGGENVIRLVVGAAAVAAGASVGGFGAALVLGVVVLVAVPSSLRVAGPPRKSDVSVVAALGGIAGGTLIGQVVLTGQPIAAAFLGASPDAVTSVFATTAVFRAPYLVALGLALRSMQSIADAAKNDPSRLVGLTRLALAGGAVGAVCAGALGAWIGDDVVAAVFGAGTALDPWPTGLVVFGSVLALVGLGLTLVLIGIGATHGITVGWLIAAVAALVPLAAVDDVVSAVAVAFAVSEAFAVVALSAFALRGLAVRGAARQSSSSGSPPE